MANVTITQLPAAGPITGAELVPIVQNGQTVRTTALALAGSPVQTQTFLTLNQEPSLPNSRALSGGLGIGLADGGALSTLQIALNGVSGSLELAPDGLIVKSSGGVVARSVGVSGVGLSVTNGSGVSGNPTLALSGLIAAVAQVGGTGLLAIQNGATAGGVLIAGTASQIDVANGNGLGGNPTISLAANAVFPGTGAVRVPVGTTAQRPVGTDGLLRYNTDSSAFEVYENGGWSNLPAGAVTLINTGTGLSGGPITSTGTISIANTGVSAGSYGTASSVGSFAVNAQGQLTSASSTSIAIAASQITSGELAINRGGTNGNATPTAGAVAYGTGSAYAFSLAGSSGQVLLSAGTNAPTWENQSSLAVGTATNVAGGAANQIVFNTGASATSFIAAPTIANTFLEWSGSAFQWAANPLGTVTSVDVSGGTTGLTFTGGPITTSGTITAGGTLAIASGGTNGSAAPTAGAVPYGTGTAYGFSAAGSSAQVLLSGGTGSPTWSNQSDLSVGVAANTTITDDTTTNDTMYLTWVTASTGNLPQKVTSTKLTFNPSTGALTATGGVSGGTF